MTDIAAKIKTLKSKIPVSVKLVAVSKTRPVNEILEAYNSGLRLFGENRVQELLTKTEHLPDDIEWHLIGHLQTNKVKYIVPFISMIQSVDSFNLLKVIDKEASKVKRNINCLLQFYIADEETKFGFSFDEAHSMMISDEFQRLKNVSICGVMGMATFTDDEEKIRNEFRFLKKCFDNLKSEFYSGSKTFSEISMGMSGDFMIAIGEGSTMIRTGSIIFGERN